MIALSSRQRSLLLFLSASAYIAWFAGLGDSTEAQGMGAARAPSVTIDARPPLLDVASIITHDPFSGKPEPPETARQHVARGESDMPGRTQLAMASVSAADSGILVPDIDARSAPAIAPSTLVLRATIVGPEPVAYVANGSAMDIVRVGDTLGERRVTNIDLRGIVFNDGTRLDLPDNYVPTPAPKRPPAANERLTLRALQQFFAARERTAETPAQSQVRATPQAATAPAYPTPAPLPTVDTHGLPVGVNPTDNPSAPTPYAYPYPYAPRRH